MSRSSGIVWVGKCWRKRWARPLPAQRCRRSGGAKWRVGLPATPATWFGQREAFTTFQWHYDCFALPPGATRVLTNAHNVEQGYSLGKHLGMQCHIEMTRPMVETWCRTGAAELPAHSTASMQSREDLCADLDRRLADLARVADDVYARWAKGLVG